MTFADLRLSDFLDAVAAKQPTPGGGAVASVVAALAAALGRMVVNYSAGKKSLLAHDALHQGALRSLQELGARALELAEEDAAAYGRLNALWKLEKNDPKRIAEFGAAVEQAIAAPHAVLHACMETLRLLQRLCGATSRSLASDLAMAAILAEAGARSAAWNVRINLPLLEDESVKQMFEQTLEQTLGDAGNIAREIELACMRQTKPSH
ncbi:MAG TPA: cyclodeaminase/cyclohydrolase family protein [Phycisphaerales bacterium]|nr:cyclodeaminase/cyclohydrolase family protein [Phycisphaerales bacterium]